MEGIAGITEKGAGRLGRPAVRFGLVAMPARLERASSGYESARSVQLSYGTATNLSTNRPNDLSSRTATAD